MDVNELERISAHVLASEAFQAQADTIAMSHVLDAAQMHTPWHMYVINLRS